MLNQEPLRSQLAPGLHTAAGRNLKKLYQPPYVPHVRSSGSLGSLAPAGATCRESAVTLLRTESHKRCKAWCEPRELLE